MFEYIKGTLVDKDPSKAVVEAGGIGYRLSIPLSTFNRLPPLKNPVELDLSHIVREDSETLYAFMTQDERNLFETVLTVSGIGPKTASAIIGHIDIAAFQNAIAHSDIRLLSKIPGIGKKTAERLVIEMRDKFKGRGKNAFNAAPQLLENSLHSDAFSALINLGYTPLDAQKAIQVVLAEKKEELDLGKLITAALQKI
ncbi:MAG TPA: Holliday junction branch migration protein RuvA [Chlamydiales bacterium]|jgi:Holliday junction DNA helicase RuvA|nr:Holliday junction branch migration protein RuvA [Chlamydiales bacterium]